MVFWGNKKKEENHKKVSKRCVLEESVQEDLECGKSEKDDILIP